MGHVHLGAEARRRQDDAHLLRLASARRERPQVRGYPHTVTFEDEEERAHATDETVYEITRKCPKILNDWTLAQPCIDRNNRYRQFILGMEKRMITNNFSLRLATTLMGILFTNVFFCHRFFNSELADFKVELGKLAYRLMYNPHAPSPTAAPSPQTHRAPGGSPSSRSPDSEQQCAHPLRQISKFDKEHNIIKKTHQLRCALCHKHTSWYCVTCTEGPNCMVPICPHESRGGGKGEKGTKCHPCEFDHCAHPLFRYGKHKRNERNRARGEEEEILSGDDQEDEGEEGGEEDEA